MTSRRNLARRAMTLLLVWRKAIQVLAVGTGATAAAATQARASVQLSTGGGVSTYPIQNLSQLLAAVAAASTSPVCLLVPSGSRVRISENVAVPHNATVYVEQGGALEVAQKVTFTVLGEILAGSYEIFEGLGSVDLDNSASEYNLAWFRTPNGHINERWDFARRGMRSFRSKIIRIPRPKDGQQGVAKIGTRVLWEFSGPITFSDAQNAATIYVDGEFTAGRDCDSFMLFSDSSKPENVYFYGPVQAFVPPGRRVGIGLEFRSASRVSFFGQVVLNGFRTSIVMGGEKQIAAVEDIYLPRTQLSFFSKAAIEISARRDYPVQNVHLGNIRAAAAQQDGTQVVILRGQMRDVLIDQIYYATDAPKNGFAARDAEDVVLIESNNEGAIIHIEIGSVYHANARNGVRIQSVISDRARIRDVDIRRVFGKFQGSAAQVNHCTRLRLGNIENESDVVIGEGAAYTVVHSTGGLRRITDLGLFTVVNGIGHYRRGATATLQHGAWQMGTLIYDDAKGYVYLRTGLDQQSSDFMLLRGTGKGPTAMRPVLGAADFMAGYLDTTLHTNGRPIWWTGTKWVDATGNSV